MARILTTLITLSLFFAPAAFAHDILSFNRSSPVMKCLYSLADLMTWEYFSESLTRKSLQRFINDTNVTGERIMISELEVRHCVNCKATSYHELNEKQPGSVAYIMANASKLESPPAIERLLRDLARPLNTHGFMIFILEGRAENAWKIKQTAFEIGLQVFEDSPSPNRRILFFKKDQFRFLES